MSPLQFHSNCSQAGGHALSENSNKCLRWKREGREEVMEGGAKRKEGDRRREDRPQRKRGMPGQGSNLLQESKEVKEGGEGGA
jgi:hypothetical protein